VRRALFEQLGGLRVAFEGCEDDDLLLRATEVAREVVHVPDVLYHVRMRPADGRHDEARRRRATSDAFARRGSDGARRAGAHLPTVSLLVVTEGFGARHDLQTVWPGCEHLVVPEGSVPTAAKLNALAERASGDVLLVVSSRSVRWRTGARF
jgi:hypothetical protein